MASVKKHINKKGEVTYYIRCYDGYDSKGKQIEHSKKWKPSPDMSERQIEKELQRQLVHFEEAVKRGTYFDSDTRFSEYAQEWLGNNKPSLAPKTYERYTSLLKNINLAIGEIKLCKLQSHHLLAFYNNLREGGIKQVGANARSDKLSDIISGLGISKAALARASGISASTISAVCKKDGRISIESANKIADALCMPVEKIFVLNYETDCFAPKTILHHHRLISTILAQATRDRLIPFNPADRSYMKAPRVEQDEAVFLNDEQAREVLDKLNCEPIKWKTIVNLLIYSGMRRGEASGLEWDDIDFKNRVIHIRRTSQYVKGMGIITKEPKTRTSVRTIKLSAGMFELLEEYRKYWLYIREGLCDR